MKFFFKKSGIGLLCVLWMLIGIPAAALAENAFEIDVDRLDLEQVSDPAYQQAMLTAKTQYIRVSCQVEGEQDVTLCVKRQESGETVYQKSYGPVSGRFQSDEIYLKYTGSETVPYAVILTVGEKHFEFPFFRQLITLTNNTACTYGVRIRDVQPGLTNKWQMATALDLSAVRGLPGGRLEIPVCASDMYVIGTATVRVRDDSLRVTVSFLEGLDITLERQAMYLWTDPGAVSRLWDKSLDKLPRYATGTDVSISGDLGGQERVILYLPMTVTYDPNGLERFSYDLENDGALKEQLALWRQLIKDHAQPEPDTVG